MILDWRWVQSFFKVEEILFLQLWAFFPNGICRKTLNLDLPWLTNRNSEFRLLLRITVHHYCGQHCSLVGRGLVFHHAQLSSLLPAALLTPTLAPDYCAHHNTLSDSAQIQQPPSRVTEPCQLQPLVRGAPIILNSAFSSSYLSIISFIRPVELFVSLYKHHSRARRIWKFWT